MRNHDQILSELGVINEFVLKGIPDNNIGMMLQSQSTMVTYLATTAALVAEAGKLASEAKVKAYHSLKTSSEANKEYWAASLAKDYVNAKCGDQNYAYEYAQRMNAAVSHSLDALRTAISAEKSLLGNLNYQH